MTPERRPARLVVCAALGIEARAAARPGLRVVTVGVGPRRARRAAARLPPFDALAVTGFAGSLDARVGPGSLVVATEIRGPDGTVACRSAELIAGLLERDGATVHRGPLLTRDRVVTGRRERAALAATGALAVDMESAPLAAAAAGRPCAVVRAVVDTPEHPLFSPATLTGGLAALRRLRTVGAALACWGAAVGPRRVLLAAPTASRGEASGEAAVRAVGADLVLVVGPAGPGGDRLVGAAEGGGTPALRVERPADVPLDRLAAARTVGVVAGATAPPAAVDAIVAALRGLGPVELEDRAAAETSEFTLPKEVRP